MNFFKHKYFYFYLITLTLTLILFEIGSYLTNLSIIKKNSFYTKKNDLVTNDSNFFDNRTRLKYFLDQKKI